MSEFMLLLVLWAHVLRQWYGYTVSDQIVFAFLCHLQSCIKFCICKKSSQPFPTFLLASGFGKSVELTCPSHHSQRWLCGEHLLSISNRLEFQWSSYKLLFRFRRLYQHCIMGPFRSQVLFLYIFFPGWLSYQCNDFLLRHRYQVQHREGLRRALQIWYWGVRFHHESFCSVLCRTPNDFPDFLIWPPSWIEILSLFLVGHQDHCRTVRAVWDSKLFAAIDMSVRLRPVRKNSIYVVPRILNDLVGFRYPANIAHILLVDSPNLHFHS